MLLRAPVVALGLPVRPGLGQGCPLQPGDQGVDTVDGPAHHAPSDSRGHRQEDALP